MPDTARAAFAIDRVTSTSVCRGVADKLKQTLPPDSALPQHLAELLEEMRRREAAPETASGA